MGEASLIRQHQLRFHEGEHVSTENKEGWKSCEQSSQQTIEFGEYKVSITESEEYKLVRGDTVIATFSKAKMEEDRILFPLGLGVMLEVSKDGIKEIFIPEKAELCGLIASEGSLPSQRGHYRIFFHSADIELIKRFNELFEKVYGKVPNIYKGKGELIAGIANKEAYYDLKEIGAKTGPYRYHVPLEHLDKEGLRAYLRGFFSGDGSVAKHGKYAIKLRISSKYKDCLEEVREALVRLGFNPSEVRTDRTYDAHYLEIYSKEQMRFIEEIGSCKPSHIERFKRFLKAYKEGKVRRGRIKKRKEE